MNAMKITRRAALTAGAAAFAAPALGQQRETIRFLIGAAPGGPVEGYARVIAEHMQKTLGATIVVETKPGANGSIAAQTIVELPPDGKTLWIGTQSMIEINHLVYANVKFQPSDFTVLMKGLEGPIGLVVNPNVPAKTFPEFIDWVKKNPGKLSFTTYSAGTSAHFLGVQFNERFGTDLTHAPYRGSAPQVQDLIAGHAQIGFVQMPGVMAQIEAGTLRPIVTTGAKRFGPLPDTPTLVELGYPDFLATVWYGLMVRHDMPDAIKQRFIDAAKLAHADPDVRKALAPQGLEIVAITGEEMREQIRRDSDRWAKIIRATGFKATTE